MSSVFQMAAQKRVCPDEILWGWYDQLFKLLETIPEKFSLRKAHLHWKIFFRILILTSTFYYFFFKSVCPSQGIFSWDWDDDLSACTVLHAYFKTCTSWKNIMEKNSFRAVVKNTMIIISGLFKPWRVEK